MIRFLDTAAIGVLAAKIGLEKMLVGIGDYLTDDFKRWPEFDKSPRAASHSPLGVIEVMPIADACLYSFKYVNGHPANTEKNLPTVMAFGLLARVQTGLPLLLSEMTVLTAMRTAATSAVAASKLARAGSKRMAVIGCGAQSEFQILAFRAIFGIQNVTVFDISPSAMDRVRRNLASYDGLTLTAASSIAEAVRGADIITTLTAAKSHAAILTPDLIEPGMHINAVGGDCPGKTEIHPDILRVARVAVEYTPQTRIEGDIQQMPPDFPVVELWRVLLGTEQGRQSSAQVTVFDSVGFALEDFSVLRYANDKAVAHGIGGAINLIATPKDPRDLYSVLQTVF
jgi:ornithine cyclodeaminase